MGRIVRPHRALVDVTYLNDIGFLPFSRKQFAPEEDRLPTLVPVVGSGTASTVPFRRLRVQCMTQPTVVRHRHSSGPSSPVFKGLENTLF